MRRLVLVLFVIAAACSSSHNASPPTPTTNPESTTTSTVASVLTTTATVALATTTSTPTSKAAIVSYTLVGATSPITCNAPTQIELRWTTTGAASVAMHIDGGAALTHYANGPQDQLLPLTCDGKSHTYTLVATDRAGVSTGKTLTVLTKTS
jgi:FtsP/CotA-like multicopper oxidase with cupredoxin domain